MMGQLVMHNYTTASYGRKQLVSPYDPRIYMLAGDINQFISLRWHCYLISKLLAMARTLPNYDG